MQTRRIATSVGAFCVGFVLVVLSGKVIFPGIARHDSRPDRPVPAGHRRRPARRPARDRSRARLPRESHHQLRPGRARRVRRDDGRAALSGLSLAVLRGGVRRSRRDGALELAHRVGDRPAVRESAATHPDRRDDRCRADPRVHRDRDAGAARGRTSTGSGCARRSRAPSACRSSSAACASPPITSSSSSSRRSS